MYDEFKGKGFSLVALNGSDDKNTILKYLTENKFTFHVGMSGANGGGNQNVDQQYGVMAYPTNYLVDSKGKVLWRGVGFEENAIRTALKKAGIQ